MSCDLKVLVWISRLLCEKTTLCLTSASLRSMCSVQDAAVHAKIQACIRIHICVYVYVCVCVCVSLYICMYVCMQILACVYICVCIYAYIHTHTYVCARLRCTPFSCMCVIPTVCNQAGVPLIAFMTLVGEVPHSRWHFITTSCAIWIYSTAVNVCTCFQTTYTRWRSVCVCVCVCVCESKQQRCKYQRHAATTAL